jgi:hypothetical protein
MACLGPGCRRARPADRCERVRPGVGGAMTAILVPPAHRDTVSPRRRRLSKTRHNRGCSSGRRVSNPRPSAWEAPWEAESLRLRAIRSGWVRLARVVFAQLGIWLGTSFRPAANAERHSSGVDRLASREARFPRSPGLRRGYGEDPRGAKAGVASRPCGGLVEPWDRAVCDADALAIEDEALASEWRLSAAGRPARK